MPIALLATEGAEEFALLKDFAIIMAVAGAVVVLFRKLNQPPILGYLIAGLIVGPFTLPNPPVQDVETIRLLADDSATSTPRRAKDGMVFIPGRRSREL